MLPNDVLPVSVDGKEFLPKISNHLPPVYKTMAHSGRATCVRRCKLRTNPNYNLVFKNSWKEKTRRSEGSIMAHIECKLQPDSPYHAYLPKFVASEVYQEVCTNKTRTSLDIESHGGELVVVVELDGTITHLGSEELWDVVWGCIECKSHVPSLVGLLTLVQVIITLGTRDISSRYQ
jgi:hypothetical protein